jgi:molecular chaperone GrpE
VSAADPEETQRVVIRDNRKIDPVTGEARTPAHAAPEPEVPGEADVPKAEALLLEERTRDLQRVQAEYANYRKRADRERLAAGDLAVGRALGELLPVLDDLDRAREHGDLTGGLKAVADKLEDALTKLGLEPFGKVGDPFDPAVHEAVMHEESETVTVPTCTTVLRPGYRHKDRLLRPAMVGVTDPVVPAQPEPTSDQQEEDVES